MKSPVAVDTPTPTAELERPNVTAYDAALPGPVLLESSFSLASPPAAAGYTPFCTQAHICKVLMAVST